MARVKTTALLTTGAAEWRLTGTRGTHIAGKAPVCDPHPAWIKPADQGKWLGSAKSDWPSGITEFSLTFQVTAPQIAHFDLVYAVDSKLESATLNGQPLAIDAQKGSNALSVLKALPLNDLFRLGPNVLVVRVLTAGQSDSPMGFYAEGSAITGEKEYTPLTTEPRQMPVVASPSRSTATPPLRNWPASPAQQPASHAHAAAPLPPSAVLATPHRGPLVAGCLPGAGWRCVHEASGRLVISAVGLPLGASWCVALQDERWAHPHTTRSQVGRCVLTLPSLRTSSEMRVCACLEVPAGAAEQWSEWRPVLQLSTMLLALPVAAAAIAPAAPPAPVAPPIAPPPPPPALAPATAPKPLQPVEPPATTASKCDCKVRIAELEATVRSQGRAIEEMRSLAARMEGYAYGQRRPL